MCKETHTHKHTSTHLRQESEISHKPKEMNLMNVYKGRKCIIKSVNCYYTKYTYKRLLLNYKLYLNIITITTIYIILTSVSIVFKKMV